MIVSAYKGGIVVDFTKHLPDNEDLDLSINLDKSKPLQILKDENKENKVKKKLVEKNKEKTDFELDF